MAASCRLLPELPFAFARNFGAILTERQGAPVLLCRQGISPDPAGGAAGGGLCLRGGAAWQRRVRDAPDGHYQRDSSEARQLMEDLGNEMDFFALAEELPQSEDLLDADDDAPSFASSMPC